MRLTAQPGGANVDDGTYEATLIAIEEVIPDATKQYSDPYLRWTFHIYDTADGQPLIANSSQNFGPKSKARTWLQSILGRLLQDGEEVDTDDLLPLDCQVTVKKDQDTGFSRITDVLAERKRRPAQRPQNRPGAVMGKSMPAQTVPADEDDIPL